jgi:hypothetical protein
MNVITPFLRGVFLSIALLSVSCSDDDEGGKDKTLTEILNQLDGIYIHLEYTYGLGVEVTYQPYLLFKDQSIYKDADIEPATFNAQESKKTESEKWGQWEKRKDEIVITWNNGKTSTWKAGQWYLTKQALEDEKINGCYQSLSGISNVQLGGSSTVLSVENVCFDGNKFTYETFGGSTNESATAYASETKAGTYKLRDHIITLTFNNGVVDNKLFFFMPDSKEVFGIGSTYYIEK